MSTKSVPKREDGDDVEEKEEIARPGYDAKVTPHGHGYPTYSQTAIVVPYPAPGQAFPNRPFGFKPGQSFPNPCCCFKCCCGGRCKLSTGCIIIGCLQIIYAVPVLIGVFVDLMEPYELPDKIPSSILLFTRINARNLVLTHALVFCIYHGFILVVAAQLLSPTLCCLYAVIGLISIPYFIAELIIIVAALDLDFEFLDPDLKDSINPHLALVPVKEMIYSSGTWTILITSYFIVCAWCLRRQILQNDYDTPPNYPVPVGAIPIEAPPPPYNEAINPRKDLNTRRNSSAAPSQPGKTTKRKASPKHKSAEKTIRNKNTKSS